MQYNSKGLTPSTLDENLTQWTQTFQSEDPEQYGTDFAIAKESVIGNLCTASSLVAMDFEEILLFLQKNMNPYTAEGEYQDILYKLIGLERTYSTYTVVQRTVEGTPNTTAAAGSILFKNKTTQDQFKLNDDCQIGADGKGIGSFTAEELGAIDLPNEALCEIITAPANVTGVYYSEGNQIQLGQDYESNSEFMARWQENQSLANSDSEGGIKKYLMPYATGNSAKNISIRQNRNTQKYEDVPLHSMNIVINSAYDDETIAQAILDHIKDGVGMTGDIKVTLEDSEGTEVDIYFSHADIITVYFKIVVTLENNVYLSQVQSAIKSAITNNFNLNMGDDVIANKFAQYVYSVDGIAEVNSIQVSTDELSWKDKIEISEVEKAELGDVNVTE